MRFLKTLLVAFALCSVILASGTHALAQQSSIGTVDLNKVIASYKKAQDVEADLKVKEAEIQKFIAEAQKQLKDATTPVERNNLEQQLSQEFKTKQEAYRKTQIAQSQEILDEVLAAITQISSSKGLSPVLTKNTVLVGGVDITEDVISKLNK